jgi:hypothetical protein
LAASTASRVFPRARSSSTFDRRAGSPELSGVSPWGGVGWLRCRLLISLAGAALHDEAARRGPCVPPRDYLRPASGCRDEPTPAEREVGEEVMGWRQGLESDVCGDAQRHSAGAWTREGPCWLAGRSNLILIS